MASFGSFETEREVYTDPIYTVYYARKQGDPGGEYAVKVFPLPVRGSEAERSIEGGDRDELERARQNSIDVQETAAAVSRYVAPVLERGNDTGRLWYATGFYSRSVNKMMSGKVALPRASLEHIIHSLAQGALDMKRACGRSHGDIRPSNVQVSKTEKLTQADVFLCDPLPGDSEQAAQYELADLHAIGLILLQLVLQRMISSEDATLMLPISPGTEWTRIFGSDASDWLALCNRLLDANLSLEQFTLEALVARLQKLKPKARASRKLIYAGGIGVILVCLSIVWTLRPHLTALEITSDPPGAAVILDHVKQEGTTPLKIELKQGTHLIIARQEPLGLGEQSTNCVISKQVATVHFQFAYGSVAVRSGPSGATVLRGGVSLGRTTGDGPPLIISPVAPGAVRYQLNLDGYEPAEVTGLVVGGQRLELAATLHSLAPAKAPELTKPVPTTITAVDPPVVPATGVVEFRADPVQALILDGNGRELGRLSGDTGFPLTLTPGQYAFSARAEGLDDVVATIVVKPQETNRHTFVFDCGTVDWASGSVPATVSSGGRSQITPASFVQRPGVPTPYVVRASGYRTVTNEVTVGRGGHKSIIAKLEPLQISVALVSEPAGAEFLTENGTVLQPNGTNKLLYSFGPGPATLVARYAGLGAITNRVELTQESDGSALNFKFDYGLLVLTNLPPDVVVYEGDTPLGAPTNRWVYQKAGAHAYALRGRAGSQTLPTNIAPGLNFLRWAVAERSWKNSLGMWFAWVPHLPGGGVWPGQNEPGGWVGIWETTQGQYKKMNGSNPSFFQGGGENYPVENLSWEQAMSFCRWLSSADTTERSGWQYTLPTDEQFNAFVVDADRLPRVTNEGRTSSGSMDEVFSLQRGAKIPAASNLNAARTHPEQIGSTKRPNQYGLYDVVGNVWEWLARSYGKEGYYAGGSYLNFSAKTVTAKARERTMEKGPNLGFRVILIPRQ